MIEVFHSVPKRTDGPKRELQGKPSAIVKPNMHNPIPIKHTNVIPTNIDHIPPSTTHSDPSATFCVFQDNEAVIKIIIKSRSPTMRHVSRTHRVALDWLLDKINLDPKIQIRYTDTKHLLADILTKRIFTRDEWNILLHLFNILLHQEFQLDKLLQNDGEEGAGTKRKGKKCGVVDEHIRF